MFLFPNVYCRTVCAHLKELSSSICYMYRLGLTKLALEVFHFYRKNKMLSLVNQMSLKYVMLCAAEAKDSRTLHMAYNSQSAGRQNSVILNCTDCDGLLLPPSHLRALSAVAERREGGDLAAVVVPGEPRVPALRGLRRQRPVQQRDRR